MVSVPLRGNGFETGNGANWQLGGVWFPSPCGVMGLKPGLYLISDFRAPEVFPSPCGVMGLKRTNNQRLSPRQTKVSVPLRGNGFETLSLCVYFCLINCFVSVPLRGNGFETLLYQRSYTSGTRVSVPLRGNGFETPINQRNQGENQCL